MAGLKVPTQVPTKKHFWQKRHIIIASYQNTVLINVVGLPLAEVLEALQHHGVVAPPHI